MTAEQLLETFKKETGLDPFNGNVSDYIHWLEDKIIELENKEQEK